MYAEWQNYHGILYYGSWKIKEKSQNSAAVEEYEPCKIKYFDTTKVLDKNCVVLNQLS